MQYINQNRFSLNKYANSSRVSKFIHIIFDNSLANTSQKRGAITGNFGPLISIILPDELIKINVDGISRRARKLIMPFYYLPFCAPSANVANGK